MNSADIKLKLICIRMKLQLVFSSSDDNVGQ